MGEERGYVFEARVISVRQAHEVKTSIPAMMDFEICLSMLAAVEFRDVEICSRMCERFLFAFQTWIARIIAVFAFCMLIALRRRLLLSHLASIMVILVGGLDATEPDIG